MAKKKRKQPTEQGPVFMDAIKVLKPFADAFKEPREIDAADMARAMHAILELHGDSTTSGVRAICSAWHWLQDDEDVRPDIGLVSEESVASDFWMAFWFLGSFHGLEAAPNLAAKKKGTK